jgi:hypothetical protein
MSGTDTEVTVEHVKEHLAALRDAYPEQVDAALRLVAERATQADAAAAQRAAEAANAPVADAVRRRDFMGFLVAQRARTPGVTHPSQRDPNWAR